MKIEWTLGKITVAIATVIVLSYFVASVAQAETDQDKVFKEVMKECKHTETSDALIFFPIPMGNMPPPTLKEIEIYVNSQENYKKSVAESSPCWTYARWKIYARAELMKQRVMVDRKPAAK